MGIVAYTNLIKVTSLSLRNGRYRKSIVITDNNLLTVGRKRLEKGIKEERDKKF